MLYARVGDAHCPRCGRGVTVQSREQILTRILMLSPGTPVSVLAQVVRGQKGEYRDLFDEYLKQGFIRARVDGQIVSLSADLQLDRQMRHDIEIVVDRLDIKPSVRPRLAEAVEVALKIGKGTLIVATAAFGEGEAPAEPQAALEPRLGRSLPSRAGAGAVGSRAARAERLQPVTSSCRSTMPVPTVGSALSLLRRSCSASIVPRECVRSATGWASTTRSTCNC